jgi:hypothetical protein
MDKKKAGRFARLFFAGSKEARTSFLKKRSKKLLRRFAPLGHQPGQRRGNQSFFASFLFTKKKCLLAFCLYHLTINALIWRMSTAKAEVIERSASRQTSL